MRTTTPLVYPRRVARHRRLGVVHRASHRRARSRQRSAAAVHSPRVPGERRPSPGRQAAHRVPLRTQRRRRSDRSSCVSSGGGWSRSLVALPHHGNGGMGPAHRQLGVAEPNAGGARGRWPRVLGARGVWERYRTGGGSRVGGDPTITTGSALGLPYRSKRHIDDWSPLVSHWPHGRREHGGV